MKNMGDGRRIARVEKEVQSVISTYTIQKLQCELPGLVTITRVQIPADLRTARVYVSLLQLDLLVKPKPETLDEAVDVLQSWAPEIQREIGTQLKMKFLPKLTFFADESTEKILKVEKIISEISQNKISKSDIEDED